MNNDKYVILNRMPQENPCYVNCKQNCIDMIIEECALFEEKMEIFLTQIEIHGFTAKEVVDIYRICMQYPEGKILERSDCRNLIISPGQDLGYALDSLMYYKNNNLSAKTIFNGKVFYSDTLIREYAYEAFLDSKNFRQKEN